MEQKSEIIQLLIDNEMALNSLYLMYARLFPAEENFWKKIAGEEADHAGFIAALNADIQTGKAYLNESRFDPGMLRMVTDYVSTEMKSAESSQPALIQALSVSLDLEKSMLERKYFEVFKEDSNAVQQLLNKLRAATEQHVAYIKQRWEAEKNQWANSLIPKAWSAF